MDNCNIDTLIQDYLAHCKFEKGLSPKTLKAYKIDLTQFADFIKQSHKLCCKEDLHAYIAFLHSHYKVKSVKRKIASIKAFYNHLEYEGLIAENPFAKMKIKLHEPFILPHTIPIATVEALLQCAYQQKAIANKSSYQYRAILRDIAILELLFATGMRVSELCFLRADAVDLIGRTVKIYGKGSKERIIQIGNDEVLAAVTVYYQEFSHNIIETGWFFINRLGHQLSDQSVRFMISKYTDFAGIGLHITPHMFRHSFATLLLEEDVDIRYIQQLLGHSSIVTTQIYTHVTSKKQMEILTTKHPRNKFHP